MSTARSTSEYLSLKPVALSAVADATDLHTPFWVMDGLLVFSALMVAIFAKEIIKTRFNKGGVAPAQA